MKIDRCHDYTPLMNALGKFGDEIEKECRINDMNLPWCPMLPYVYSKYASMEKKIFYVGQDTMGWNLKLPESDEEKLFSFFFQCYDERDFQPYLQRNSKALTLDERIYSWPNKPGSFWFGVNSLQLKLLLDRNPRNGLRGLSEKDCEIIDGIGYANLNSIELKSTLKSQKYWNNIAEDLYWKIKKSSEDNLDGIKYLLQCFNPDCVVIASWSGKSEDAYFSGCTWERCGKEEKKLSYVKVQNYMVEYNGHSCKVIWTYHPRAWGRCWDKFEITVNELAKHIKQSMI